VESRALTNSKVIVFAPTTDAARARGFYEGMLGLRLTHADSFALAFDVNGTALRVTTVGKLIPAEYTILGWQVDDIVSSVGELRARGVAFLRIPGLEQDDNSVWTSPDGNMVAWFKDPDGNILSLTELVRSASALDRSHPPA
jgi:catechol 2,3-dioxygenase-like lactoylglutathione lyase family enzyme